jgi:phosphoribosylformimino-5-aminoimidazole carboxamide ribotide isomerase
VTVLPAVDVRGGRVVRLLRGASDAETVYGTDPAEAARRWEAEGAQRLHVVDLDAAMGGAPQFDAIAALIAAVSIPVEVGGGIRTLEGATRYREHGADRVIFGTAAVSDPALVQSALALWPDAVAIALDARNGRVAVAGWKEITTVGALELAERCRAWGVRRIQYTDVLRDGALVGPNLAATEELARVSRVPVTASGGVSSLDDLRHVAALAPAGVDEVIVGRALYDGRFTLAEAKAAAGGAAC